MRTTRLVLIATILVLSGCGGMYGKVGLAAQVDRNTDYWLQTDRDWQCSKNVQFHGEVGYEFEHDVTVYYHHQSWLLCGGPFNDAPEVYTDRIGIDKKFGGK